MKLKFILPIIFLLFIVSTMPVLAAGSEQLYAVNYNTGVLSQFDTSTNSLVSTLSSATGPRWIAAAPGGTMLYVADYAGDKIVVIEPGTNVIKKNYSITNPTSVITNHAGNRLYIARDGVNLVTCLDAITGGVIWSASVGVLPWSIAINSDDSKIYVANYDSDTISVINTVDGSIAATIGVALNPVDIVLTPDNSKLFVVSHKDDPYNVNGTMTVIRTSDNTILSNVTIPKGPYGIGCDKAGSYVYVALANDNIVNKYDVTNYNKIATYAIPCGSDPYDIPIDAEVSSSGLIYVPHGMNITVINPSIGSTIATITTTNGNIERMCFITPDGITQTSAQPVYFYVHSYYVLRWENVTISAYNNAGQLVDTQTTDNNGAATLQLTPGVTYTMNTYSSSLGINTTFTYTPPNSYSGSIQQGISVLPFTSWLTGGQAGGITSVQNQTAAGSGQNPSGYQDRDIFLNTDTSLVSTTGTINASYYDNSNLTSLVVFDLCTQNTNGSLNLMQSQSYDLAQSGNLISNSGFESSTAFDTTSNGKLWVQDTLNYYIVNNGISHSGSKSALANGTSIAAGWYGLDYGDSTGTFIPIQASKTYQIAGYSDIVDTVNIDTIKITLQSYTSGGAFISESSPGNFNKNTKNAWQYTNVYYTTPSNAAYIKAHITFHSTGSGNITAYFDDITVTSNNATATFTVNNVNANNKDYVITATGLNTYYGNVSRVSPASFHVRSLLPGVPEQWHTYIAVIVVVGIFAASVMWLNGIISLAGAGAVYVFYSMGWLDTVPGAALGVGGAVIAAIVFYWSRRETGGLE